MPPSAAAAHDPTAGTASCIRLLLPQVADQFGVSSLHINFTTEEEFEALGAGHGYLQRTGIQAGGRPTRGGVNMWH